MLITSLYPFWWCSELSEPFRAKTRLYYFAAEKPPVTFHCTERPKSFQGPTRPGQTWLPSGLFILILFRRPLLFCAPSTAAFLAPNAPSSFLSGDPTFPAWLRVCSSCMPLPLHPGLCSKTSERSPSPLPTPHHLVHFCHITHHSLKCSSFSFFLISYKHKTVECTDCRCMLIVYRAMPSRPLVLSSWLFNPVDRGVHAGK